MSKRKYRAKDFKVVDWTAVTEKLGDGTVVFAVDVAKVDFYGAVVQRQGELLQLVKWKHPLDTREVVEELVGRFGADRLEVVMEPSGTYGDVLRWQFEQRDVRVYRVSPKRVHDAAEVYDGVPSLHDAKAVGIIAELHQQGRSARWLWRDERSRDAKARLKAAEQAQGRYQEAYNRLEALLSRHWPELTTVLDLNSVALQALLADYGDPAHVARSGNEAQARLQRTGGSKLAAHKCQRVVRSAEQTLGVPCVDSERKLIQMLAREMQESRAARKAAERELAAHVRADSLLTEFAAVIGKTTAVVLLCALGDPRNYPSARSYLKGAGLNLKERSSGKHKGRLKLTKRGPGVARQYLFFAILRWIQRDAPAQRWYEVKVRRDGGLKGKAITALMRKLVRGLWAMARHGEAFDSRRLFAAPAA